MVQEDMDLRPSPVIYWLCDLKQFVPYQYTRTYNTYLHHRVTVGIKQNIQK